MPTAEAEAQSPRRRGAAAQARRLRRRDGGAPARDLGLGVLHQEPASPRLRQSAQGPAHLRQGGGGQRAGRGRGGGHPARRRREDRGRVEQRGDAAPAQPGDAVPGHGHRQRPRHRPAADPADLRQAALRVQVPPAAHEPRPAGDRDLGGRHVRPADDRQAGADHLAHRPPAPRPTTSRCRSTPRRTSRGSSRTRRSTGRATAAPR